VPKELTKAISASRGEQLTGRRDAPFVMCFSRQLQNDYEFSCLTLQNMREFHRFFTRTIGISVSQVDSNHLRPPDRRDLIDGHNIQHYEVTRTFRIHGYYENAFFHVIRLDPRHRVHR
jgi:hypothetical protein